MNQIFIHYIWSSDPTKPSPHPEIACTNSSCLSQDGSGKCNKKKVVLTITENGVVCKNILALKTY